MDALIRDLKKAYVDGDGYALSMTLSPIPPASDPNRLRNIYASSNFQHVTSDLEQGISYNSSPFQLSGQEGEGWVGIYHAYWKALGEILKAEESNRNVSSS